MGVPLLLAPMAELSHRALRELIEYFGGCDFYFSEMISAGALAAGGSFEKWYMDNLPKPEKLVFQLVGPDSEQISKAASILDRIECAGIDINMGCSAPLIRKTGAGSAWMKDIDRAGELISRIRPIINRRFSVKLRTGYNDDFEYLVRFCRRLEEEGVEFITLHPRLVHEKFKRHAKWEYVGALKKELKIPVAGNGDISDAQELVRRAEGPCDAVMVGRAAVRQPWIFAQANLKINTIYPHGGASPALKKCLEESAYEPPAESLRRGVPKIIFPWQALPPYEEIGLLFLDLLVRYQPPEFHLSRAKRFFGFFCDNLKFGTFLKNQINREDTLIGIEKVWREYFVNNEEI